ncbi:MAG: hypothetical protein IJ493_12425 [Clostridia bacterium]|nr:hypothetical protein [Clostridia bacterium]
MEILEIMLAVLAVYGLWSILTPLKERLLYPKKLRQRLRCAVEAENLDDETLALCAQYARYLRLQTKISPEQLIILRKDDIMEEDALRAAAELKCGASEVYYYRKCGDFQEDGEREGTDHLHRNGGGCDLSE